MYTSRFISILKLFAFHNNCAIQPKLFNFFVHMKDTVQLISHTMIWLLLLLHDLAIVLTIERGCRTLACAILQRVKMSNHYRCGFTILRFLFLLPKRKSFYRIDWFKAIWTYPNLSEPFRTYANLSEPFRTYSNLSQLIQTYLNLFVSFFQNKQFKRTVCNYRHSLLTTKILQDFLNFLSPKN